MTDAFRDRAPRQLVRMPLIYDRGDRYVAANLLDISETGVLLSGDETAPVGKQVTLYADLNDHQSWPIHIEGLVVRHADTGRMGVRFMYASVAQLTQMRLFVQAIGEQPELAAAGADGDKAENHDKADQDEKNHRDGKAHGENHSDDEDDQTETPEGEPTFESLSDAERKDEIDDETEAAEGESLDTIDQHEANRAEEREDKIDDKAKKVEESAEKAEKKINEEKAKKQHSAAANENDEDDAIVQHMRADSQAWTTLVANDADGENDFRALNLDRELAALEAPTTPAVTARREHAVQEALLDGEDEALPRPRALRASLSGVYGILDLDERYCSGALMDLSETGFFLATDEEGVELGQDLKFIPHDTDDESLPFELSARVVRIQDTVLEEERPRGIACRLTGMSLGARDALKAYLRSKYVV